MIKSTILANKKTNQFQTVFLILAMTALLGLLGTLMFGWWGFVFAIGLVIFGILFGQQATAAYVLKMYKARPIATEQAAPLIEAFEALCQRADLEHMPQLYYIPTRMPNAFAVGTGKSAAVAITDGLIRMMNPREITAVLAHEVAHIMHQDIRVMGLADTIARTTSIISRFGLIAMFLAVGHLFSGGPLHWLLVAGLLFASPSIMIMLQLALSRTREFNADQGSAELSGDPLALASALKKLDRPKPRNLLEKLFRPGQRRKEPAMLRTHPPTDERVERLAELAKVQQTINTPLRPSQPRHMPVQIQERVRRRPRYHFLSGLWH